MGEFLSAIIQAIALYVLSAIKWSDDCFDKCCEFLRWTILALIATLTTFIAYWLLPISAYAHLLSVGAIYTLCTVAVILTILYITLKRTPEQIIWDGRDLKPRPPGGGRHRTPRSHEFRLAKPYLTPTGDKVKWSLEV